MWAWLCCERCGTIHAPPPFGRCPEVWGWWWDGDDGGDGGDAGRGRDRRDGRGRGGAMADDRDDGVARCVRCGYGVEADDVAVPLSGRTAAGAVRCYCVRCYHAIVGDSQRMPDWLRREVERTVNRD